MGRRLYGVVHRAGCRTVTSLARPLGEVADGFIAAAHVAPCCRVEPVRAAIRYAAAREAATRDAVTDAEPQPQPVTPARVTPPCDYAGCTTHARNLVRVTADGGVILILRMCQRHTLALGRRAEVIGGVR